MDPAKANIGQLSQRIGGRGVSPVVPNNVHDVALLVYTSMSMLCEWVDTTLSDIEAS